MRALEKYGCDRANAQAMTEVMLAAERDGARSHGLFRLAGYVESLRLLEGRGAAVPRLIPISSSAVRVDAQGGFAPLALKVGLPEVVNMARDQGIAALAVNNCRHYHALWWEVEEVSRQGLCALACTAAYPYVAATGGRGRVFGTNPIAFSWPRGGGLAPVTFDMSTAAMSRGDIQIAAQEGRSVPLGTGLDKAGEPTTDAEAILDGGAQLPFGGYKGTCLALMIELLAGPLIGDHISLTARSGGQDSGDLSNGPPFGGETMLVFSAEKLAAGNCRLDLARDRAETLFWHLDNGEGSRLPGEKRLAHRRKVDEDAGHVSMPTQLYDAIVACAGG